MALPKIVSEGLIHIPVDGGAVGEVLGLDKPLPAVVHKILKVDIPDQDPTKDDWCWAAVTVGICDSYKHGGLTQCSVVSTVLDLHCCDQDTTDDCDQRGSLKTALGLPGHGHLKSFGDEDEKKTEAFIKAAIDAGTPVATRMRRPSGVGHFVVVYGYEIDLLGGFHVVVGDPLSERSTYPFGEFKSSFPDQSTWHVTYETQGNGPIEEE